MSEVASSSAVALKGERGLQWLHGLMQQCSQWRYEWEKALTQLSNDGCAIYRRWRLEKTSSGAKLGDITVVGKKVDLEKGIFAATHADLLVMLKSLEKAGKDQALSARIASILIAQFPSDPAWTQEIRHRAAVARSGIRPHLRGRYYPRLLAERRTAVVLLKNAEGAWTTRKGAPLEAVCRNSGGQRSSAIREVLALPGLTKLELPQAMDWARLEEVVQRLHRAFKSGHPKVAAALAERRQWSLAFRCIRGMGVKGCFDAPSQTVVVDPRHLESLLHEVCHWLLGHDVDLLTKASEASEGSEGGEGPEQEADSLQEWLAAQG